MMYKDKFVLAVKVNDKVLREFKDTVYLPFGSEYSLYLKNLNTVRAMARVWIDGQEVTESVNLIVPANGHIDLERFIRDGNLEKGNKFKFIERTSAVEKHRGIEAEDGLVRVEVKFEKTYPSRRRGGYITNDVQYFDDYLCRGRISEVSDYGASAKGIPCSTTGAVSTTDSFFSFDQERSVNDVGITAAGSVSDQRFVECNSFTTEHESHVIVLKLLGETEQNKVVEAITVKTSPECTSCGRKNKNTAKFCTECGTALQIV